MAIRSFRFVLPLLVWGALLGVPAWGVARNNTAAATQASSVRDQQDSPEAHMVSFGLFGDQSVFESEARGAARILRERLRSKAAPIVSFNGKRRGTATAQPLAGALRTAGAAMDRDNDVLVVV